MYDINLTMSNIIVGQEFTEPIDTLGIGYLYFNSLKEHAKKNLIAQIDVRTGETDTYASLLKRSIRTALYLKEIGIQKDDVVCLIGSNHLNSCVPFIASHFIGAIPSSIETLMPYDDLKHLINLIEPKIFFVTPNKVELVEKILRELKKKSQCVIFGDHENHICFDNIIKEHKDENTFQPEKITDLKETAMLYFSSGTTGLPKAVCLNHYSFMICALNKHEPENLDTEALKWQISKISNQYVGLTYKHLSWISAGLILFKSLYHGNIVILAEEFNSTEVWHIIEKYNVNLFSMLITHAIELIQNGKPDDIDVSSLTTIILAGARIPNSIFEDLRKLFPTTLIFQSYAQTELTGMNTFFNTMDKTHRQRIQENPQAVGYAGKYVTYKVVDPETEDILGPNQEGELRFKSATMMNGYYKMDSKPYFDDEGYFKSGDVGYYDDNNCFFITNRIKEIFKYGDVHVSPAAIEEVIYRHPAVREAAVIGVPDVEIGDRAVGVVVLKENVQVTPEEIKEFVDSQVDETKKLRGGLIFVDSLPYGSNGKIKVMQLRSIIINSNSNRISDV